MRQSYHKRLDDLEDRLAAQRLHSRSGDDFSRLSDDELFELERLMLLADDMSEADRQRHDELMLRVKPFPHDAYHRRFTERRAEIGDEQMRHEMSDYFDDRLGR